MIRKSLKWVRNHWIIIFFVTVLIICVFSSLMELKVIPPLHDILYPPPTPTPEPPVTYVVSELKKVEIKGEGGFEENWSAWSNTDEGIKLITRYNNSNSQFPWFKVGYITADAAFYPLTPDEIAAVKPTWSPDGKLIAFEQLFPNKSTNVMIMNADGTKIHQAMDMIPEGHCVYAPRWTRKPEVLLVTFADTANCVPEPDSSHSAVGVVLLNQQGKTYLYYPPSGWGYVGNPTSGDDGDHIIVNATINGRKQIGELSGIWSGGAKWTQLTNDNFDHVRPVFVPTYNNVFFYTKFTYPGSEVMFFYNGKSYSVTGNFSGSCKDPDVRRVHDTIEFIVTCTKTGESHSDFYTASMTLSVLPSLPAIQ